MASFLDYYTRLNRQNGYHVKVVYYEDNTWKKLVGELSRTLGSDCVIISAISDVTSEVAIPFFGEKCIIQSIELSPHGDETDLMDGGLLFLNPYDVSKISFNDEEIRKKVLAIVFIMKVMRKKYLSVIILGRCVMIKYFLLQCKETTFLNF